MVGLSRRIALCGAALVFALGWQGASAAATAPAAPPISVQRIVPAQPSGVAPDQIGVVVFFDFTPESRRLLARLHNWGANGGTRIVLDREPLVASLPDPLAHAFVVGRTLGVLDAVLPGLFKLGADAHAGAPDEAALEKVFAPWGIDTVEFDAAWNSPTAAAGVTRAQALAARYGVTGAPVIVVNGVWRIVAGPGASAGDLIAALNDRVAAVSTMEAENQ